MNCFKKIVSVFLTIIFIISLASCSSKSSKAIIYFELESEPYNLDPQTAYGDSELLIVRNMFEGLMRKNDKGEVLEGACSSYTKEGLKYTFKLRKKLKWSDGTELTAEDFVFGLQRAVKKETEAPFVRRLFSIKGARDIYQKGAAVNTLGVSASGNSVIITLEKEDPMFLTTLSTSVAMPCNKEFFEKTEGKYGQDAKSILCNGSYDIYKWNKETFAIRLYKNEKYNGNFKAKNGGVFLSLLPNKNQVSRIVDNDSDMAFLPAEELSEAKRHNLSVLFCENKCWFLTIGDEYDQNIKNALLNAFSTDLYTESLGDGFRPANSIYPGVLDINNANGEGLPQYNIATAKNNLSEIVKDLPDNKFPSSVLYYYDCEAIKPAANALLGHWQQNLSAFINMQSSTSLTAFEQELKVKSLQFALFPVSADGSNKDEYLEKFGLSGDAVTAQKRLLSNHNIIPFAYQTTNVAHNESITTVYMDNGNGFIDFAFVVKKV